MSTITKTKTMTMTISTVKKTITLPIVSHHKTSFFCTMNGGPVETQRISQTNKMLIMVMIMVMLMMILVICGAMSQWRILPGGGTLDGDWVTLKYGIMQWSAKRLSLWYSGFEFNMCYLEWLNKCTSRGNNVLLFLAPTGIFMIEEIKMMILIGPESDHWLCLSLTD